MAKAIGQLREGKATFGEKEVFRLLVKNLPNDFTVYAECPVTEVRQDVHPDFIVLTNYGIVVLEVKDWAVITKVDAYAAYVYSSGETKRFPNPVETVRNYAQSLKNKFKMHKDKYNRQIDDRIPFGYAVVMTHSTPAQKTHFQRAWGENYVFNRDDLLPGLINKRIRETIPTNHITQLTKAQMDLARSVINPEIKLGDIILDEVQEEVVMEDYKPQEHKPIPTPSKKKFNPYGSEFGLFENEDQEKEEDIPEENLKIVRSSYKLVRGLMGSGKTSVLKARARRLATANPDWKILVLSFNKGLAQDTRKVLAENKNIESTNIHALITSVLRVMNKYEWRKVISQEYWLRHEADSFPIIKELGVNFIHEEISWIQDVMLRSRSQYLRVKRVGRGSIKTLNQEKREQIYDVLEKLNVFLDKQHQFTFETMVLHFLDKLEKNEIVYPQYDAILIDEAQDFAPSWIKVVNFLLKEGGSLFLADDPSQSIFRYFTWAQKGVDVVGRTRWLRKPYRSTKQIFEAARAIVKDDPVTQDRLKTEGNYEEPDLESEFLREGNKPLLNRMSNLQEEINFIDTQVNYLRQKHNVPFDKIALVHNVPYELSKYRRDLSKYKINFHTCRTIKGLEFEAVIFCGLEGFFRNGVDDQGEVSHQKSLIYTTMGRAKNHLFMTYRNTVADQFSVFNEYVTHFR